VIVAPQQKHNKSIPKPVMDSLTSAQWPGNVRELENFIERAVILTQGDELNVRLAELKKSSVRNTLPVSTFQEAERQAIIEALKAASGRISGRAAASERLGLKRTTLQNKTRRLNITKADYCRPAPRIVKPGDRPSPYPTCRHSGAARNRAWKRLRSRLERLHP